jgi:hypothetical protein
MDRVRSRSERRSLSWYWLAALVLGGWMLVSIVVALAFGRVIAALDRGHDVLTLVDGAGLDAAVSPEALEVAQTAPGPWSPATTSTLPRSTPRRSRAR